MAPNERRNLLKAALITMGSVAVAGGVYCCGAYCYAPPPKNFTRQELINRLERLAQSEPPKNLAPGAMCYEPACFTTKKEIPCPECKRTMAIGEKDDILREYNVPLIRIQDQGIRATLIPPDHCPNCGDGLKTKKFQLEIKYPDLPDPVRVELTDGAHDLEIMALFLQNKDRYELGQGTEVALKDKLDRLRELFGVKK